MTENNTKFDFEPYVGASNETYQLDDNTCVVVMEAPGFTKDDLTATLSLKTTNETNRKFYQLSIVSNEDKTRFTGFAKTKFAKFNDVMAKYAANGSSMEYKFNRTLIVVHPADHNFNFAVDCVDGLIYVKITAEKIQATSDVKLNFGGDATSPGTKTKRERRESEQNEDPFDRINKRFGPKDENDYHKHWSPEWKYWSADFNGIDDMFKTFEDFGRIFGRR